MELVVPPALAARGIHRVRAYALPLRHEFRRTTVREGVLLEGPAGWGEFAPFPEYDDTVAARWLAAGVEAATVGWLAPVRTEVAVNAIVPGLPALLAAQVAREAYERSGTTTVKVKVAAGSPDDDVARVEAVRDAVPGARIRADANGGWTLAQARAIVPELGELELVEQPCAGLADCAALRDLAVVAVDEGLRTAADLGDRAGRLAQYADVAVVKVPPLGGVRAALAVAERTGLPVVVSGALDTAVGLAAGVALAAALPEAPYAAGLGTGHLLARDVVPEPLVPRAGVLRAGPVTPDERALGASPLPSDRVPWWQARLARVSRQL